MQSFGARLILLLTGCAALIVGAGMLLDYRLSREELLQRVVAESTGEVRAVLTEMETWLRGVEGTTRLLGHVLEQQDYSREDLRQLLRRAVAGNRAIYGAAIALAPAPRDPQGFAPYYFRRDGDIHYADLSSGDADYQHREWYRRPARSGVAGWSEPYFDRGGGEVNMVTFSVPVFRDRGGRGPALYAVVTADVELRALQQALQQLHLGKSSYSLLLSREGVFMSTRTQRGVMQHYSAVAGKGTEDDDWPGLFRRALAGETVSAEIPCPESEGRCTLRMGRLQTAGWPLAVVYDQRELLAPLQAWGVKTATISALTLVLMALAVYWIISRQTRPLRELTLATENLGRGRMDYPLPRASDKDEVGRLVAAFGRMYRDLKRHMEELANATASRSRLEGELAAAREIQMSLLPGGEAGLNIGHYSFWARVEPARSVGGDLYTWRVAGDKVLFAIGDVSDKGVPAALFMARAISLLQHQAGDGISSEDTLFTLNNALERDNPSCMFVTLFLGELDTATGLLRFASAGHPAPCLCRSDAVREIEQLTGPPLGLARDQLYPANQLQMEPGDSLAVYTDGVTEAFNPEGGMFGEDRLIEALAAAIPVRPAAAGAALFGALADFAGGREQSDDISLLLLSDWPTASGVFPPGDHLTSRVLEWVDAVLRGWHIPAALVHDCKLLAEEVVTNIEKYAQLAAGEEISLRLVHAGDALALEARDRGRAFDPLAAGRERPLPGPDAAEPGGLGVHLIALLSHRQSYRRETGENILRVELDITGTTYASARRACQPDQADTGREDAMSLTTTVTIEPGMARVLLDGALNTDTAPAFEQRLQEVVDAGHPLTVLDMRDLDYISSAGLRVIFKAAKTLQSSGRKLAAANRRPHIEKVFEILKALPDMAVFANEEELDDYLAHMQQAVKEGDS